MLRGVGFLAALLTWLALVASPAGAAQSRRGPCSTFGLPVVAATDQVVVFRERRPNRELYYACRWNSRRSLSVAKVQLPDETFTTVSAAGPFVGISTSTCPKINVAGCVGYTRFVDVVARRVRGTWPLPGASRQPSNAVVNRTGGAAWSHTTYPMGYPATAEAPAVTSVYSMSPAGQVTLHSRGEVVDRGSLALGTTLTAERPMGYGGRGAPTAYWIEGGTARSALLP
jgi:hypothetical protein